MKPIERMNPGMTQKAQEIGKGKHKVATRKEGESKMQNCIRIRSCEYSEKPPFLVVSDLPIALKV